MFRFTIRELILLTLVVAMGVGWWIDRRSNRQAQDALHEQVMALNKQVKTLEVEAVAGKVRQFELQKQLKHAETENLRLQLERDSSHQTASPDEN